MHLISQRNTRRNKTMVCDLFEFAYIPNWYLQLDDLAEMALPEPWRFCDSDYSYKIQIIRFWNATFNAPSASWRWITTTNRIKTRSRKSFTLKTNFPASIQGCIPVNIKKFMLALSETIKQTLCFAGISGDLRMNVHRCCATFPVFRKDLSVYCRCTAFITFRIIRYG